MHEVRVGSAAQDAGDLLFLVGARRSGTNWLERMLTTHPAIAAMPSETYLFSKGVATLSELVQHTNPAERTPGKTFVERGPFLAAVRSLLDEIFTENRARHGDGARYLLERTPWHATSLPLIAAVYPEARVLHIVRDGRAVARSLLSMHWGPTTIEEAAGEWRDCALGGRTGSELFGRGYMEVRYEELLSDPPGGVRAIFDWLGLECDERVAELIAVEADARFNVDPASPELRADKWRDELTKSELAGFDRVAGAALAELGYDRASPATSSRRTVPGRLSRRPKRLRAGAQRARRSAAEMKQNLELASQFMEHLASGEHDQARGMCSADAFFSLATGEERVAGRGDPPFRALAEALASHRAAERAPAPAALHPGGGQITSVGAYELRDGSRWARTIVIDARKGLIHSAALYRYELAG